MRELFVIKVASYVTDMHIDAQVQLSFLMVDHTHEDIDQVFSKISMHMMKTSVHDMDGN